MGKERKVYRAYKTFVQCTSSYLIIILLGFLSIKLFDDEIITSLVCGIIASILSIIMSKIEEMTGGNNGCK